MSFSTRQSILGSICLTSQNVKISDRELSGNGERFEGIEREKESCMRSLKIQKLEQKNVKIESSSYTDENEYLFSSYRSQKRNIFSSAAAWSLPG